MNRSDILWRDGADSYSNSVRLSAASGGEAEAVGASYGQRIRALATECFPSLKGYAIEFLCNGGRVFLKSFRETNPNDPLELQPHPASPAGPAAAGA